MIARQPRREVTPPRPGLALRYAVGVASLRRSDVLLASFPRSGSTWLRFVVVHDALAAAGDEGEVPFERLNGLAPELGASALWRGRRGPRLVKTHRPYAPLLGRPRAVHLVRQPLDALASYHRYWTARVDGGRVDPGAFLRDRRRGLPRWIRHTRSWQPRADLSVRYAELRADPAGVAARVLALLGRGVDPDRLAEAVRRSDARAVRAVETTGGVAGPDRAAPGAAFASDQPAGNGLGYFDAADVAWAHRQLDGAGLGTWVEA